MSFVPRAGLPARRTIEAPAWSLFVGRPPVSPEISKNNCLETRISLALGRLKPQGHPPSCSLESAFNWGDIAAALDSDCVHWFVVVFRSKRKPEADTDMLYVVDALAHAEAKTSGGLLAYYYGYSDTDRRGLAMCVWRSADDAKTASDRPFHKRAAALAESMYETYRLETFFLRKVESEKTFAFQPLGHRDALGSRAAQP